MAKKQNVGPGTGGKLQHAAVISMFGFLFFRYRPELAAKNAGQVFKFCEARMRADGKQVRLHGLSREGGVVT